MTRTEAEKIAQKIETSFPAIERRDEYPRTRPVRATAVRTGPLSTGWAIIVRDGVLS